ncbi:MAG: hypothetical protein Q9163_005272 [Psora crenata]
MGSEDDTPMIVMLHGLSGGSHEIYLRHTLKPMTDAGWKACVVNSRGCAKSKITSGILYNARATWDVRQTYLAEEGSDCPLKGAVVISNPWNLDASSLALQRTWLGLNVYSKAMGTSLKILFEECMIPFLMNLRRKLTWSSRHVREIEKQSRVDIDRVRNIRYFFEFDRELQGPTWGYPTEGAYYRDASSCDSILAVKVPLFAINAEDDPLAVNEALPFREFKQNPYTVLCTTSKGGHLGWFESGGGRWFTKPACQFLQRMVQDVDLKKLAETLREVEAARAGNSGASGSFVPTRRKLQILSKM